MILNSGDKFDNLVRWKLSRQIGENIQDIWHIWWTTSLKFRNLACFGTMATLQSVYGSGWWRNGCLLYHIDQQIWCLVMMHYFDRTRTVWKFQIRAILGKKYEPQLNPKETSIQSQWFFWKINFQILILTKLNYVCQHRVCSIKWFECLESSSVRVSRVSKCPYALQVPENSNASVSKCLDCVIVQILFECQSVSCAQVPECFECLSAFQVSFEWKCLQHYWLFFANHFLPTNPCFMKIRNALPPLSQLWKHHFWRKNSNLKSATWRPKHRKDFQIS